MKDVLAAHLRFFVEQLLMGSEDGILRCHGDIDSIEIRNRHRSKFVEGIEDERIDGTLDVEHTAEF